jgi:hypothetical protein
MKKLVFVATVLVAALLWALWIPSKKMAEPPANGAALSAPIANGALPPSAVFNIDPRLGSSARSAANGGQVIASARRGQLPPVVSPFMSDYLARRDFPSLMSKLAPLTNDAEALFLRAQILDTCAKRSDQDNDKPRKTPAERRGAFVATLSPTHPDTAQRLIAYDTANPDACGSLRNTETTGKEITDLLARATELKDPVALARDLNCEIAATSDNKANGSRATEINDSRVDRIRQAIASRNAMAVRVGVGMLANTYRNGAFRLGPDAAPVDQRAMGFVANILACQYGADCNIDLQRACANEGKCRANNFDDYLAYYQLSPSDAQAVEAYRAQLTQMIDSGDFSSLTLTKGDQPLDSVRTSSYFSCTP